MEAGLRKQIEDYSYCLGDRIGQGFSSVVYRGIRDSTGEPVAIKVIDLRSIRDEAALTMLKAEIDILKAVKHPNILYLHNVYSTSNNCYIVTEYCDSGDLASLMRTRGGRLSEAEALPLFRQVFQGFKELAHLNILHRDLKPANIFLNGGVAKIADFGFGKFGNNSGEKERYNVGTPLFMSPEALRKNVYSIKNDIWSMGITLFEMLFGRTPWESRNEQQLIENILRVPVRFPGPISEPAKDFIRACCQVDEHRRITLAQMEEHPLLFPPAPRPALKERANQEDPKGQSRDRACRVLISVINFCRFIRKTVSMAGDGKGAFLRSYLLGLTQQLKEFCAGQNNFLRLKDPEQLYKWEGFEKYKNTIQEYYRRYSPLFEEIAPQTSVGAVQKHIEEAVRGLEKELGSPVEPETELGEGQQNKAVLLDYLLTLFQLNNLLGAKKDFMKFEAESRIDSIAESKPGPLKGKHLQRIIEKAAKLIPS